MKHVLIVDSHSLVVDRKICDWKMWLVVWKTRLNDESKACHLYQLWKINLVTKRLTKANISPSKVVIQERERGTYKGKLYAHFIEKSGSPSDAKQNFILYEHISIFHVKHSMLWARRYVFMVFPFCFVTGKMISNICYTFISKYVLTLCHLCTI